jgi:FtsH-binding integral membrane protein
MAIVTGALVFYSMAVITEQRKKLLSSFIMTYLTIGIILDVTATAFMIAGSRKLPFTFHGILGYSALLAMLIDTILTWRHWKGSNMSQPVPRGLHLYTRFAYLWWVLAYFAGGLIASIGLS